MFVLLFLLVVNVSALEIQTDKDEFKQGETFMATIQGNILEDIESEDIGFYERHVEQPLTFDLEKIDDVYFISALLPFSEKNFTLKIKDVYYKEKNKIQTDTIEKNFTISSETADFGIEPSSFKTKSNLTISISNNLDNKIIVSYTINETNGSIEIPAQDSSDLKIGISLFPSNKLDYLTLSSDTGFSYSLPVFSLFEKPQEIIINGSVDETVNKTDSNSTGSLIFLNTEANETLNKNTIITRTLDLKNIGEGILENISISVSENLADFVNLSITSIDSLEPNESIKLEFSAFFSKLGNFSGFILADSDISFDNVDLNFFVGENITPSSTIPLRKTCAEMGGKRCNICSIGTVVSLDEPLCCLGSCEEENIKKDKKNNWIAIVLILAGLAIIAYVIYIKLKKPKPTAQDILEKRKNSYSKKYNINEIPEELKQPKTKSDMKEDREEI